MRSNAQPDGRPLGESELRSIFRRLWTKKHRIKFVCVWASVRSLQRRFPIDDVLLHSGDIRDQVAKLCEIGRNFDVFGPPNFGGKGQPKFLTEIL